MDVLKLYRGEVVIHQNPEDIDLDGWLEEGELTELPEVPITKVEERVETEVETSEIREAAI